MLKIAATILIAICLISCSNESSTSSTLSSSKNESFQHMVQAVALNNQATEFSNKFPTFQSIPSSDLAKLKSLWSAALAEGQLVNISVLNIDEPGFGDIFRDKFIKGLELCVNGDNQEDLLQGQLLLEQFGAELSAVKAKKRGS